MICSVIFDLDGHSHENSEPMAVCPRALGVWESTASSYLEEWLVRQSLVRRVLSARHALWKRADC
jgi:hypothetical protein